MATVKDAWGRPIKAVKPTGADVMRSSFEQWDKVVKTGESNRGQ